MKTFSIFGLGTVLVDHQVYMEHHPQTDTKGEVHDDRYQVGGPVPTALCLLSRLGVPVTFQGQWGNDPFGQMIESDFNQNDIRFLHPRERPDSKTGFAHVWVECSTGRRTIAAYRGSHPIETDQLCETSLRSHDALHLDGWSGEAAMRAAEIMSDQGGRVFMDLGSPKPDLIDLLRRVDHLNCPAGLLEKLFPGEAPESSVMRLLHWGPKEITVTHGSAGAWHVSESGRISQSALNVKAMDTNGAGDVFNGAMIFATMQGWAPEKRLRFACAAAGLKCRNPGNRDALPCLQEIQSIIESSKLTGERPLN